MTRLNRVCWGRRRISWCSPRLQESFRSALSRLLHKPFEMRFTGRHSLRNPLACAASSTNIVRFNYCIPYGTTMAEKQSFDYEELLERAKKKLPVKLESHDRFQVPEPDVMIEGKTTVIRNFGDIVDALRREPEHLLGYLLRELGTAGTLEGRGMVFKGKVSTAQVADRIKSYVDEYVL